MSTDQVTLFLALLAVIAQVTALGIVVAAAARRLAPFATVVEVADLPVVPERDNRPLFGSRMLAMMIGNDFRTESNFSSGNFWRCAISCAPRTA